ncbi:NB-ARC domain-containing protein [Candidatus Leptofilum sp.]|uniref:NB-ARC domain-containing protein n=1 Tax=Candidatus Leptofilum sp. TaxID=3241576 RepID=UPI003B5C0CF4
MSDSKNVLHNLPRRKLNEPFVGRNKISSVVLDLLLNNPRAFLIAISGVAGVGKTSLALHIAHKLLDATDASFEVIVWASSKTELVDKRRNVEEIDEAFITKDLEDLLDVIAKTLDINCHGYSVPDKEDKIKSFLQGNKILLIIDNLESLEQDAAAEILRFARSIPFDNKCLVTSRIEIQGEGEHLIRLFALSFEECVELINAEQGKEKIFERLNLDRGLMLEIYHGTGGIPLAIKWIMAKIRATRRKDLTGLIPEILDSLYTAENVLAYCFQQLFRSLSERAKEVLMAMSLLNNPIEIEAIQTICEIETSRLFDALRELKTRSLIEETTNNQVTILPLTKSYASWHLNHRSSLREKLESNYVKIYDTKEYKH